jgi:hypothetical protein
MKTRLPERIMKQRPRPRIAILACALLSATACKSSSKATIEAEKRADGPAGATHTASPSPYATVRPPDGPFYERSPPEGPVRTARMRDSALVPHEEFFEVYAKEFGLGPKDEVRYKYETKDSITGTSGVRYLRYHDGYAVEHGWYTLTTKKGLVKDVLGSEPVDLPDTPRIAIAEERAKETALAEAARQTGRDRAEMRIHEVELVWARRVRANQGQPLSYRGLPHDLVYRCRVVDAGGNVHTVDIDVKTGAVTAFTDGSPVGTLGPDDVIPPSTR